MSTSDKHNWEDHWCKEMKSYAPLASTEDWHGMTQLLDHKTLVRAHRIIEQEPIGGPFQGPWLVHVKALLKLPWWGWGGALLLVVALSLWLRPIHGGIGHQEIDATIVARDSFPPKYALNRYWIYDKEGNRVGAMHSDTVWMNHTVRKRGVYALLSPGKVANYRIDTVFRVTGRGKILSFRQDTVYKNRPRSSQSPGSNDHNRGTAVYRFDTIYQLDAMGNLTDSIHAVDTTISYVPPGGL